MISVVSLYGKEEESESSDEKIHIKSIPPPKILSFSGINPRLREIKSSNMLNFSMELSISWDHPQFDGIINSYEIYCGVGKNMLYKYGHLHEEIGLVCIWIIFLSSPPFMLLLYHFRMCLDTLHSLATMSVKIWSIWKLLCLYRYFS